MGEIMIELTISLSKYLIVSNKRLCMRGIGIGNCIFQLGGINGDY